MNLSDDVIIRAQVVGVCGRQGTDNTLESIITNDSEITY